jgi:hypothetical protein
MATIDTSLVDRELRGLLKISQGIKKLVRKAFEKIEKNPAAFPELSDLPDELTDFASLVAIRKVKIISQKHDFRILFAHWKFDDGTEHADLLMIFPRKDDYRIDWDWISSNLKLRG